MTQHQYSQAIKELGNQIKLEWMSTKPDLERVEEMRLERLRLERQRDIEIITR